MRLNKMRQLLLSFIFVSIISGCATVGPMAGVVGPNTDSQHKSRGKITTDPPGATITFFAEYYFDFRNIHTQILGTTPQEIWIQSFPYDNPPWLSVGLEGYETVRWQPPLGLFDKHLVLKKDFEEQIKQEFPNLDENYVRNMLDVIGKADKALNSPRMLFSSIVTEARSAKEKLDFDQPSMRETAISQAIDSLIINLLLAGNGQNDSLQEKMFAADAIILIQKIRNALRKE